MKIKHLIGTCILSLFPLLCFSANSSAISLKVIQSCPTYPGYGIENSLDGNAGDDYTAFFEQKKPHQITLKLSRPQMQLTLKVVFESIANYAKKWQIELLDDQKKLVKTIPVQSRMQYSFVTLEGPKPFQFLRMTFTEFAGQKRLLLRQLEVITDISNESAFKKLDLSSEKEYDVSGLGKRLYYTAAMAEYCRGGFLLTDYVDIHFFDTVKNKITTLKADFSKFKKAGKSCFYQPTGVTVGKDGTVYIANYMGNNILTGRLTSDRKSIIFENEYRSPNCVSPENVTIDEQRDVLLSANYDGGTVTAFILSSRKALWTAKVPQAHGITFDDKYVYATGLVKRNIVKIEFKTGKIVLESGSIGWNPAKQQFLWPVSIDCFDKDTLIVADAHNGFISLVDKKDLQVKSFFGGNGLGKYLFNYPYVCKVLGNELWISSCFEPEIIVLNKYTLKGLRRYSMQKAVPRKEHKIPFGQGWDNYINYVDSDMICFQKQKYRIGIGQIHHAKNIFYLPLPESFFNPCAYLYLLQQHTQDNVTLLWSSSSESILMLVEDRINPGACALFVSDITVDSWKDGDGIATRNGKIKFKDLVSDAKAKYAKLKQLRSKHAILAPAMLKDFFAKGLTEEQYQKLFNKVFVSQAGIRFKSVYDRYHSSSPDKVRDAARLYYKHISQTSIYKRLDEYILIGMLTGIYSCNN